jgi:hypothetical protein
MIPPVEFALNATRVDPDARSSMRSGVDPCLAPGLGAVSLSAPDSKAMHQPPRATITPYVDSEVNLPLPGAPRPVVADS